MICWICGKEGFTGEHLIKASDLKSQFGQVSQDYPLYYHSGKKKNIPVGSLNSKRLKSNALICNSCNSSTTQPHDKAWEQLSSYLKSNITVYQKNNKIKLSKIFPGSVHRSMLYVHLYFLKIFGCIIVENKASIPIGEISESILKCKAHKNIYIAFGENPVKSKNNHAGYTPIHSVDMGNESVFASWMYVTDNIAVNIIYADEYKDQNVMRNTWHPSSIKKYLALKKY